MTYVPGTFTINQATRDEKDITVKNYKGVYDAASHSIRVNGTADGDKVEYSYDGGTTWSETLNQYTNVMAETTIKVRVSQPELQQCDREGRNGRNYTVRDDGNRKCSIQELWRDRSGMDGKRGTDKRRYYKAKRWI